MLMRKTLLIECLCLFFLLVSLALAPPADADEEQVALPKRVWIDTDAACGLPGRVDPDDCFALVYLLSRTDIEIVGVSTVFGNAALNETDRITREIVGDDVQVYRGAAQAGDLSETEAVRGLRGALDRGPLTLLALGPLTNFHALFHGQPALAGRVEDLIVMMGKREGHLFHPSEGAPGALFGHGPIFTDFNFVQDPEAARALMALPVSKTLVPYEVARQVMVTGDDLDDLTQHAGRVSVVAEKSRAWLKFWQETIGLDGFYPFDLVAAAYVVDPDGFTCRQTGVRIGSDRRAYGPLPGPIALMTGGLAGSRSGVLDQIRYCDQVEDDFARQLVCSLGSDPSDCAR